MEHSLVVWITLGSEGSGVENAKRWRTFETLQAICLRAGPAGLLSLWRGPRCSEECGYLNLICRVLVPCVS